MASDQQLRRSQQSRHSGSKERHRPGLKEVHARFDLKDSKSKIELEGNDAIQLASQDEYTLKAVIEILSQKLVKRGVSLKNLEYEKIEPAANSTRPPEDQAQAGHRLREGEEIVAAIKDSKKKAQASIQGDTVRVSSARTATPSRRSWRCSAARTSASTFSSPTSVPTNSLQPIERPTLALDTSHFYRVSEPCTCYSEETSEYPLHRDRNRGLRPPARRPRRHRAGVRPPVRLQRRRHHRHRHATSSPAAASASAHCCSCSPPKPSAAPAHSPHPPRRRRRDAPHRHPRPRRHHRRSRHPPRPPLLQHHLGQRQVRPRRRLALHAVLPAPPSKSATSASSTCSSRSPSRWSKANSCRCRSSATSSTKKSTSTSSSARPPASSKSPCSSARPSRPTTDSATHDEIEAQLGEYGRNLGLAFQIVDDVLDLTAAEDVLGKPVASDLREGKATLAVIHALERGTGADREAIRTVLADRSFDTRLPPADPRNPPPPRLHRLRHGHRLRLRRSRPPSIADLPDSEAKRALLWVPGFVTTRDR